ncbi:hypothetical protein V2A60_009590 [Cordyceps javanica]|uniref:Uncharacterized protein n=1 Tax=Cordyceps javanica TaxID=43265 RepID=A0A545V0Z6_9HYPO|nr:hypothetical protein IF1G_06360 [Cordyceps javanica]TQW02519.1 hypothetical protein IF2G_09910 [Cordyceps javanica]
MPGPHNYTFAMQKYLLLQEQHAELSTHLQQIRPRQSSLCSGASTASSPESSPNRAEPSLSYPVARSSPRKRSRTGQARCSGWSADARRGSAVLDTIPDEETMQAISAEEQRLFDVNESIKRALTEMLNCDIVRADSSMRMWTQTRLMEAEKELRSGRRRRSSPCRE